MARMEGQTFFIVIIILIGLIAYFSNVELSGSIKLAGGVSRQFNSPQLVNTNPSITLNVVPTGTETFLIEETTPLDIVAVPEGCSKSGNRLLKCSFISITTPKVVTYTVNANSVGTYTFSGKYGLGSGGAQQTVTGPTSLAINSCTPTAEVCDGVDNNCNNQVDEGDTCCNNQCTTCEDLVRIINDWESYKCSDSWFTTLNCVSKLRGTPEFKRICQDKTLTGTSQIFCGNYNPSDTNCDQKICFTEILTYIQLWVSDSPSVDFANALSAVQTWQAQTTSC